MSVGVLALVLCTFKVFFMHTDSLWCVFHASNVDVRSYDRYIRYIWSKVLKYCVFLHILNFFSVCFIEFNNRQLFWDLTAIKELVTCWSNSHFFQTLTWRSSREDRNINKCWSKCADSTCFPLKRDLRCLQLISCKSCSDVSEVLGATNGPKLPNCC